MAGGSSRWLLHISSCALLAVVVAAVPLLNAQDGGNSSQESAGHNQIRRPESAHNAEGPEVDAERWQFSAGSRICGAG